MELVMAIIIFCLGAGIGLLYEGYKRWKKEKLQKARPVYSRGTFLGQWDEKKSKTYPNNIDPVTHYEATRGCGDPRRQRLNYSGGRVRWK